MADRGTWLAEQLLKADRNIVKSKYIVIEQGGEERVIVFSPWLPHREVAGNYKVKSAGFCRLNDHGSWVVSGRADTLDCRSRPQDVEILNLHLPGKWPLRLFNQATSRRTL